MTTIYKYRIYCQTEAQYVYVWSDQTPTVCPNNSGHTIDADSISIVEKVETDEVIVREEKVPTGGNFQAATLKLHALANTTSTISTSWPFNVTAFGVNFVTTPDHKGDIMDMYAGKNTTIGAIGLPVTPAVAWVSQNYTVGQTVTYIHPVFGSRVYTCILNTVSNEIPTNTTYWHHGLAITVSSTVLTYTNVGYWLQLNDLTNQDDLGRVLYIDNLASQVYVENNPINSYSPVTPTYVQQTVYLIRDFEIGDPWARNIGEMKIGGSHIPKDSTITVEYHNLSPSTDKDIIGHVEILY